MFYEFSYNTFVLTANQLALCYASSPPYIQLCALTLSFSFHSLTSQLHSPLSSDLCVGVFLFYFHSFTSVGVPEIGKRFTEYAYSHIYILVFFILVT